MADDRNHHLSEFARGQEDPEDPTKWQRGDRIGYEETKTLRSGKEVVERTERIYGSAHNNTHINVFDNTHPDYVPGAHDNSLVQHSVRVYKDGKARLHKDAPPLRRLR